MSMTTSQGPAGGTANAVYQKIAKRILPLLTLLFVVALIASMSASPSCRCNTTLDPLTLRICNTNIHLACYVLPRTAGLGTVEG